MTKSKQATKDKKSKGDSSSDKKVKRQRRASAKCGGDDDDYFPDAKRRRTATTTAKCTQCDEEVYLPTDVTCPDCLQKTIDERIQAFVEQYFQYGNGRKLIEELARDATSDLDYNVMS